MRPECPRAFWSAGDRPERLLDNEIDSFFFNGCLHNNKRPSLSLTLFICEKRIVTLSARDVNPPLWGKTGTPRVLRKWRPLSRRTQWSNGGHAKITFFGSRASRFTFTWCYELKSDNQFCRLVRTCAIRLIAVLPKILSRRSHAKKPEEIGVAYISLFHLLHIENTWISFLHRQGKISICSYIIRETDKETTRSEETLSKNENISWIWNRKKNQASVSIRAELLFQVRKHLHVGKLD